MKRGISKPGILALGALTALVGACWMSPAETKAPSRNAPNQLELSAANAAAQTPSQDRIQQSIIQKYADAYIKNASALGVDSTKSMVKRYGEDGARKIIAGLLNVPYLSLDNPQDTDSTVNSLVSEVYHRIDEERTFGSNPEWNGKIIRPALTNWVKTARAVFGAMKSDNRTYLTQEESNKLRESAIGISQATRAWVQENYGSFGIYMGRKQMDLDTEAVRTAYDSLPTW